MIEDFNSLMMQETMAYEEFNKHSDNKLDSFPEVKGFIDSIVAANILLGRSTEYIFEPGISQEGGGKWDELAFTRAFSKNTIRENYRLVIIERPQAMEDTKVTLAMCFYLEPGSDFNELVTYIDFEDNGLNEDQKAEFDKLHDEAEQFFESNNLYFNEVRLTTPYGDDELDEDNDGIRMKRLIIAATLSENVESGDLMNVYMRLRDVEEPGASNAWGF